MTSIYCEHLDGECFDFDKCYKCKDKPVGMIDEMNSKRIAEDASLAIYALEGLVAAAPYIHQDYLKEKLSIVKRCANFMEHFVKDDEYHESRIR